MKNRMAKIAIIVFATMELIYVYHTFQIFDVRIKAFGFLSTYRFQIGQCLLASVAFLMIQLKSKHIRPVATVLFLILPLCQSVMSAVIGCLFKSDISGFNFQEVFTSFFHYGVLFLGLPYLFSLKAAQRNEIPIYNQ